MTSQVRQTKLHSSTSFLFSASGSHKMSAWHLKQDEDKWSCTLAPHFFYCGWLFFNSDGGSLHSRVTGGTLTKTIETVYLYIAFLFYWLCFVLPQLPVRYEWAPMQLPQGIMTNMWGRQLPRKYKNQHYLHLQGSYSMCQQAVPAAERCVSIYAHVYVRMYRKHEDWVQDVHI